MDGEQTFEFHTITQMIVVGDTLLVVCPHIRLTQAEQQSKLEPIKILPCCVLINASFCP